jgi:GNAT superfamily N-acetyltransferase
VTYKTNIRKAVPDDCEKVYELICELAVFEKEPDAVDITPAQLEKDAFGPRAIVNIWVAEADGMVVGAALFFEKYSTWKGRTLHLEDLIVNDAFRGSGIGTMLFEKVLSIAREGGYGRMEWMVLDWNAKAIDFYKKYGTEFLDEWIDCRLTRESMNKIATNEGL